VIARATWRPCDAAWRRRLESGGVQGSIAGHPCGTFREGWVDVTTDDTGPAAAYRAIRPRFVDVGTAEIAYRTFGAGPPVVFLHGWPLSGFTYRKIVPRLAERFTCHVIDLPGAGETRWREDNDFAFQGQAANVARVIERLGLGRVHVVAHDTGATIARALALRVGDRVDKLALIGTEIPGHRPPWIPLFQRLAGLPGAAMSFRLLLGFAPFVRSSMGFGGCFVDRRLLGGEFADAFVRPLVESPARLDGPLRYLRGIDWGLVDSLAQRHREIASPVLFVWGAEDRIFPAARARSMVTQLRDCRGFHEVPGARLLVHEERPAEVAAHLLAFLSS
jgi:pimeloyl-ACP methyl ester carboxylesterase